jgi:4-diphosphocytidyl-2-C-methyl-D-erythritol kinase
VNDDRPTTALAPAKINLALVVGPLGEGGKHEVATVLQRVTLADRISVAPARHTKVDGYSEDTLVTAALNRLARAARHDGGWRVRIEKRIPVAAGLGGGSSDAALALRLANAQLPSPLPGAALKDLASHIGADVPFFLASGPQLGTGDGTQLAPLELPTDYHVAIVAPSGVEKDSTAAVYRAFDDREGAEGFHERQAALLAALAAVRSRRDLGRLPANDLASSPLSALLRAHGAFRADVSGAGPAVYGLFDERAAALQAARSLETHGRVWVVEPAGPDFRPMSAGGIAHPPAPDESCGLSSPP